MADFTVGAVSTGPAGSNASGTLSEVTSDVYRLDLTIPRGDRGALVELRVTDNGLEYRHAGETTWVLVADRETLRGPVGPNGASSYDLYVQRVNSNGTYANYIQYLKGATGATGAQGETGQTGVKGQTGNTGATGKAGVNGGTLFTRTTVQRDFKSATLGEALVGTILLGASYRLMEVQTSVPARIRLYTTTALRDADLSRPIGIAPIGNAGVACDLVTSAVRPSIVLAPAVNGWDGQAQPNGDIAYAFTPIGTSGVTDLSVTVKYLRTE